MATIIQFDKSKYHLINQMNDWLRTNIGPGGYAPVLDARWHIESAFGNTWYTFKDPKDATFFALMWGGE